MARKVLKYPAIAVGCLLVAAVSSALLYRAHLQRSRADHNRITSSKGIDSLGKIRIGGIDQWIHVRGENVNNPILLVLHGGPGMAFIPLAGEFQRPWEQYFTVVEWDQRGAGKTYTSNDGDFQRQTLNLAQMERDALDVANYLRAEFKRDKIIVLGHSWGSLLGLWLAHEHPDLLYAYVGVGQILAPRQNDQTAYSDALQAARRHGNQRAIKDLESIAPYPRSGGPETAPAVAQYWQTQLLGSPGGEPFMNVGRILSSLLSAPEYSLADDFGFLRGQRLSIETLIPQIAAIDLRQLGPRFRVPVFFFEGRHDPFCRPSLVQQYAQAVSAPSTNIVWFEKSGHFPFFSEPDKFSQELAGRVLPLANGSLQARF